MLPSLSHPEVHVEDLTSYLFEVSNLKFHSTFNYVFVLPVIPPQTSKNFSHRPAPVVCAVRSRLSADSRKEAVGIRIHLLDAIH